MDVYIDRLGYLRFRDSRKLFHRWVAEKKLGRKLLDTEVVHHIDRNKLNNHPSNLYVCRNQWHHFMIHCKDAGRFGWKTSLEGFHNGGKQRIWPHLGKVTTLSKSIYMMWYR